MSKRVGTFIILAIVAVFIFMGYRYIHTRQIYAISDAAFVKSDKIATLSFRVAGDLKELKAKESQKVSKGELLGVLDTNDTELQISQTKYSIDALSKKIELKEYKYQRLSQTLPLQAKRAKARLDSLKLQRDSVKYTILSAKAKLNKIDKDSARYSNMLKSHVIAEGDYEKISTQKNSLQEQINSLKKKLQASNAIVDEAEFAYKSATIAISTLKELKAEIKALRDQKDAQKQSLKLLQNRLSYCYLYAPFDGVIAKRYTVAPRVVNAGSPIYAIADTKDLYVEVLLSEKKLHGVRVGNSVDISVDAIKDKTFKGEVESISPVSASTFSLVPRDIASGEFTKLDQRFIVRVKLNAIKGLRSGMGATVKIKRSK